MKFPASFALRAIKTEKLCHFFHLGSGPVTRTRTVVSEPEPRATSRAGRRGRNADDGRRRPGDRRV